MTHVMSKHRECDGKHMLTAAKQMLHTLLQRQDQNRKTVEAEPQEAGPQEPLFCCSEQTESKCGLWLR